MGDVTDYREDIAPDVEMAVNFVTEHGRLTSYAIALLVNFRGQKVTVRLFDNAHGTNDMHRYTRGGGKQTAELFHRGTAAEAMNVAKRMIHEGWMEMVAGWHG